jgi:hypothetical protein
MMDGDGNVYVQVTPRDAAPDAELDPELAEIVSRNESTSALSPISTRGGGDDWDAPFDLRIARPHALDLRAKWEAEGGTTPVELTSALGPKRPILLTHVVTPFPCDGALPARVWGLGYEFVPHDIDANTTGVAPSNEVFTIGDIGQSVDLGIGLDGKFGIANGRQGAGTGLRAVMSQRFQFEVSLRITLRKVVGAAVGRGGAMWKMFRQNEPIDQPHTLLQTVLVPEDATVIRCTVKTWAKQAGRLGTRWGARFWPYADEHFEISLV